MFEHLSKKISKSLKNIIGVNYLTKKRVTEILSELRISLLEGDVALSVVHDFIERIKKNIVKRNDSEYLTSGKEFIRIIHSSLVSTINKGSSALNLGTQKPGVLLVVGPQGAGKTTTVGKLARFLSNKNNKKVLVASVDIYRPAGVRQLETLICCEKNIDFFSEYIVFKKSIDIAKNALILAKLQCYDILLIDTVGCINENCDLFSELIAIYKVINPIETLFVIDSMIGQVAVDNVKIFDRAFSLTGVIVTKLDGDTRGGVALSITHITNKPIKFIGIGEKINDLELFYADRIASRILGMGDMTTLMEDITHQTVFKKGYKNINNYEMNFDVYDFLEYIKQIRCMGGVEKIIDKLPSLSMNIGILKANMSDSKLRHIEAIINSMTIIERKNPNIIKQSRIKRIAFGSGVNIQDVNNFLNIFNKVRIFTKTINKNNTFKILSTLKDKICSIF